MMKAKKQSGPAAPPQDDQAKTSPANNNTATQEAKASPAQQSDAGPDEACQIIDGAPQAIRRPLCLVEGHAYATIALWVREAGAKNQREVLIVRDDGKVFSAAPIKNARPLSEVGLAIELRDVPRDDRIWSGAGVKRYLDGDRPEPADVFRRVAEVVDRFMDFSRSLADQRTMTELTGCYVLATYLLDAFHVIGYLWPNGERGAGKSQYLYVVTEMAYLGQVVLAGGSYASLRDLADHGACLAFDDCDGVMDRKSGDPDKRSLLLAGNRRGATVTLKEPAGQRGWVTRLVHTFCPRLFSAIRLPDEVLASRTIVIPLVRSADETKTVANPLDHETWPHDRRQLVDDLWAIGLANLPCLRKYDAEAAQRSRLKGRNLEPWRTILAVALWLQEEHGVSGVFDRMEALSVTYQQERGELEASDPVRLAILALWPMVVEQQTGVLEFKTSELTMRMNGLARGFDLVDSSGEKFTNEKRVGWLLRRLRFEKAPPGKTQRRWCATRAEVEALARSYGVALPQEQNAENAKNAEMQTSEIGVSASSAFSAFSADGRWSC